MYRRIIQAILILAIPVSLSAQEQLSFARADKKTYAFYTGQQWDSLIYMSRQAQKAGYDSYFMRMRYSIALYKKKNYRRSVKQLKGALNYSKESPDALELLYYSYLLSGQTGRAELVSKRFNTYLDDKIKPAGPQFLSGIYTEGVFSYFDNSSFTDQMWNTEEDGEWLLSRTFRMGTVQLEHRPAKGIIIRQSISNLGKRDYYYLKDPDIRLLIDDHRVNQAAYWLSPVFSLANGMSIIPYFNFTNIRYETVSQVSTGAGFRSQVSTYYTNENAISGGLNLKQSAGRTDFILSGALTSHNSSFYYQGGAAAIVYPLGNLSWYFKGAYYYKLIRSDGYYPLGGIGEIMTGFSIKDKAWIEFSATKGEMYFYLENDGSILYNNTDYPVLKSNLQLIIPLDNYRKTLFIGGRFAIHNAYYGYTNEEDIPASQEAISYYSYTIYSGIKWKIQ